MLLALSPLLYGIFTIIYIPFLIRLIKKHKSFEYHIVFLAFFIYIIIVIDKVFLPIPIDKSSIEALRVTTANAPIINLIPFGSIIETIRYTGSYGQIIGNIAMFVPFGFLLPCINNTISSYKSILKISFIASLCIELIQLLGSLIYKASFRFADIDDIILNTLGAVIGFLIIKLIRKKLYIMDMENTRVSNNKKG
jgi:glycopeptide antibiotics resistance protein